MVSWPTSTRTPAQAMDYIRQIKAFTAFGQLFQSNERHERIRLDSSLFKLHSQATVLILMVGTMFVSMRQYFGEPIECLTGRSDIPQAMLQHYCWLEATFSVAEPDGRAAVGPQVAYPGVKTLNVKDGEKKVFHKYYQWVYFVLIIQSIMFYIPKYLWKAKESNRLRLMVSELRKRKITELSEYDSRRLLQDLCDSLLLSRDYFLFYFCCELLCYIHLLAQIWFVNIFLSGQFLRLGMDWLHYSHDDQPAQYDPLIRVFPRMTKCLFHKYGYSGSIEKHDALCFLPLNIVNEKLYVVLWFWFAFLTIYTSLCLVNRIVMVLVPGLRFRKLQQLAPSTKRRYLRRLSARVGNWFVLQAVALNLKPSHFALLIETLVREHFDSNCNLVVTKSHLPNGGHPPGSSAPPAQEVMTKLGSALNSSAPPVPTLTSKGKKTATSKGLKSYGRAGNAQKTNFVQVNRDPPSGHSGDSYDWNLNID